MCLNTHGSDYALYENCRGFNNAGNYFVSIQSPSEAEKILIELFKPF